MATLQPLCGLIPRRIVWAGASSSRVLSPRRNLRSTGDRALCVAAPSRNPRIAAAGTDHVRPSGLESRRPPTRHLRQPPSLAERPEFLSENARELLNHSHRPRAQQSLPTRSPTRADQRSSSCDRRNLRGPQSGHRGGTPSSQSVVPTSTAAATDGSTSMVARRMRIGGSAAYEALESFEATTPWSFTSLWLLRFVTDDVESARPLSRSGVIAELWPRPASSRPAVRSA